MASAYLDACEMLLEKRSCLDGLVAKIATEHFVARAKDEPCADPLLIARNCIESRFEALHHLAVNASIDDRKKGWRILSDVRQRFIADVAAELKNAEVFVELMREDYRAAA